METTLSKNEIKYYREAVKSQAEALELELSFLRVTGYGDDDPQVNATVELKTKLKSAIAAWDALTELMKKGQAKEVDNTDGTVDRSTMNEPKINDKELLRMVDNENFSQSDAARYFGVSRQAVHKRLKELRRD